MLTYNKNKLRQVIDLAVRLKLDVTLLSEINSERAGVEWFEKDGNLAVLFFIKKQQSCLLVLLFKKLYHERSVSLNINGTVFTATYQPVFYGNN